MGDEECVGLDSESNGRAGPLCRYELRWDRVASGAWHGLDLPGARLGARLLVVDPPVQRNKQEGDDDQGC